MAHRSFGVVDPDTKVEEITFDIGPAKELNCRPAVNGRLLLELVGKVDSRDVSKQSEGILQVFDVCVKSNDGENPDDYTGKRYHRDAELDRAEEEGIEPGVDPTSSLGRLYEVLDDPDVPIRIEELAELVGWLVEQYTASPKDASNVSPRGAAPTNRTSRRSRRNAGGTTAELTPVS